MPPKAEGFKDGTYIFLPIIVIIRRHFERPFAFVSAGQLFEQSI